jgi:hypothetical protein
MHRYQANGFLDFPQPTASAQPRSRSFAVAPAKQLDEIVAYKLLPRTVIQQRTTAGTSQPARRQPIARPSTYRTLPA